MLVVAAVGVLGLLLSAGLAMLTVVREVHVARSAADLSALAAAAPLTRGGEPDCGAARSVAAANAARLTGCASLPDGSVETSVESRSSHAEGWVAALVRPSAAARAGLAQPAVP